MISIIAAVADNDVIGNKNSLPWYLPEDLKRFKEITTGKTVLMGRNTYDSIIARNGKPLPNRKNVVVSRRSDLKTAEGVLLFPKLEDALETLANDDLFVIGGAQIFEQTLNEAERLYITEVHKTIDGDVKFPEIDKDVWKETSREDHDRFSFVTYEK